ncbi:MAG: glycosyltransferase family 2 protein [Conexivisphaerales archaeon]
MTNANFKKPYISVIIVSHIKSKYLIEAIKSTLNQTLNRDLYEIIVVKNYKDEEIDNFMKDNNIINIYTDIVEQGGKIVLGIENSSGEIISFLDYDDLFYPNKLEYVYNLFNKYKKLGYYKNNYFPINERGDPTKFINKSKDFNLSSISIRKNIININYLRKVKGTLIDSFVYCSALESNYKILANRLVFTKYRVHNSSTITLNLNFNDYLNKIKDNTSKSLETMHTFSEFFKSERALKYIKSYIFDIESFNFILFGGKKPKNLFIYLLNNYTSKKVRMKKALAYFAVSIFPKYFREFNKRIIYNSYNRLFK